MLARFFVLAAVSPGRQRAFRSLVCSHLVILIIAMAGMYWRRPGEAALLLGNLLLVAGIVEGALLLGWRLAQLPKSQALEFLLVSPLRPPLVFTAEALVGIGRLFLVSWSSLPLLAWSAAEGSLNPLDLVPLLIMPVTWGTITGLGLATWAYEPQSVRRWGERLLFCLIILYLLVGVLAGEHLRWWVNWLPWDLGQWFFTLFVMWHQDNPFGILKYWLENDPEQAWQRWLAIQLIAMGLVVMLLLRAAWRLQGHFHERHYQPACDDDLGQRGTPGDRPLAWWAVRRVTEYSGRINLYLAGGFGLLYAIYTVAGPAWPSWLGKQVFQMCDRAGGMPMLLTAMILLASVPAAFQYGLWDSSIQDRCRRLELLLLTRLDAQDYWEAAVAAAWRRGRGYFAVALLLAAAAVIAGQISVEQMLAALAAGAILWGLYFALGFRAFSRGLHANALGLLLTVGLPGCSYLLYQLDWPLLAATLPPGSIYQPCTSKLVLTWLPGVMLGALGTLVLSRMSLAHADAELRSWYDRNHGSKVMD